MYIFVYSLMHIHFLSMNLLTFIYFCILIVLNLIICLKVYIFIVYEEEYTVKLADRQICSPYKFVCLTILVCLGKVGLIENISYTLIIYKCYDRYTPKGHDLKNSIRTQLFMSLQRFLFIIICDLLWHLTS